jgi:cellobiose-specific phosphotransferase system component IIC
MIPSLVAGLHRFSASAPVEAINEALPWSFAGLAGGLAYFMLAGSGTIAQRFAAALVPAFAPMSLALVVLLSVAIARRMALSLPVLLIAALGGFLISVPHGGFVSFDAFVHSIGAGGLLLGLLVTFACTGAMAAGARRGGLIGQGIGAGVILAVFAGIAASGVSLAALLTRAIMPLADLGDHASALVIITVVEVALLTVGIHGPALLAPIVTPVYLHLVFDNFDAYVRHRPIPHVVTVSTFLFVFPGGAGATLGLVLLLLRSKVARVRRVALTALVPSLFNINEPLLFGLPIVLNPILALPFVLAPTVLALLTYFALATHLVDRTIYWVPSTVPSVIGGVLATKDWRGAVLVCVNLAVATLIYVPFVRWYERSPSAQ